MRKRLTNDNPTSNTETMLNLAYAKDGNVYLRYGVEDVNLCDYVSGLATNKGCNYTPNEIMEGACLECDCEVNLLYCLAVQAAELRERLKHYEDLEEQGQLIVPPCKVGDTIYKIPSETNYRLNVINGHEQNNRVYEQKVCEVRIFANNKYLLSTCDHLQSVHSDFYKENWFLTKEEAEKALGELKCQNKN